MTSSIEAQRVVVIQDASREVSSSAVRWALQGLSLKPGDMLTLLSVLHQVDTPSKSPNAGTKELRKHLRLLFIFAFLKLEGAK